MMLAHLYLWLASPIGTSAIGLLQLLSIRLICSSIESSHSIILSKTKESSEQHSYRLVCFFRITSTCSASSCDLHPPTWSSLSSSTNLPIAGVHFCLFELCQPQHAITCFCFIFLSFANDLYEMQDNIRHRKPFFNNH